MFILKSNKVPALEATVARECIVVNITKPALLQNITGTVTFYRNTRLDETPQVRGWSLSDGTNVYTVVDKIGAGVYVYSRKSGMSDYNCGTITSYSGFIPRIAGFQIVPAKDRGIALLRARPAATEYRVRVPNTAAVSLSPSMDHDLHAGKKRSTDKYVYGLLIIQDLEDRSHAHFTSYEDAVLRWENAGGLTESTTLDTNYFYSSNYYSGVLTGNNECVRIKIMGEIYLDTPGTWEIWDYRDDCSACDFGGSIGYINSATESWSKRASYESVGNEWVPFTWYFAEWEGGDYFGIHIKGPNDSSHRDFTPEQLRYSVDLWNTCPVPPMPELVFHMPLQTESSTAATGQSMITEGSPVYETVDDISGVYLDGDSYIYTSNTTKIPTGNEGRVLCCWARPQEGCEGDYMMSIGTSSTGRRFGFGVADAGSQVGVWGYNNTILYDYNPVYNKWHHIMVLFQGNHEKLFVNGRLIACSEHRDLDTGSSHICIGTGAGDFGHMFIGHVSDVRIYKGACGMSDIQKIYKDCMRVLQ